MEVKMSELKGSKVCNIRRSHEIAVQKEKGDMFQIAMDVKEIIHKLISGEFKRDEIHDIVTERMGKIKYFIDETRNLKINDLTQIITRYYDSVINYCAEKNCTYEKAESKRKTVLSVLRAEPQRP